MPQDFMDYESGQEGDDLEGAEGYENHSVRAFVDALGYCETLRLTLRAIDKYSTASIRLRFAGGGVIGPDDDTSGVQDTDRITHVRIGGIAWDGSDWEYGTETELPAGVDAEGIRKIVADLGADFDGVLADYRAERDAEDEDWDALAVG